MRLAIIDIGTNTCNLLIAGLKNNSLLITYEEKLPVKLGEGGMLENKIQPESFQRGIDAVLRFSQLARHHHCNKILAFATSAVRGATNGNDFVRTVFSKTGVEIQVIDGNKEAEFIASGARHAVQWNGNGLIMDIGGGSTEFIIANQSANQFILSTPLGVSRLKEMFLLPDPVTEGDLIGLKEFIRAQVRPLADAVKLHPVNSLIGCAGSFDSLADIISIKKEGRPFDFKHKSGMEFVFSDINKLLDEIILSNAYQRAVMQGLPVFRQPYMVYAAALVKEIIDLFGIKTVYLSAYSLKEGVFYEAQNS